MRTTMCLALICACATTTMHAQAPRPGFEVASVRPNTSATAPPRIAVQAGGRWTATNVTLRMLIRNAYGVQDVELFGVPDWAASESFDIIAKAEENVPPGPPGDEPGPMQLMLQSLLEQRFVLRVHREARELPVYELLRARPDRLGPKLQESTVDCAATIAASLAQDRLQTSADGRPLCGLRLRPGQLAGSAIPIAPFARTLSSFAQRPVVDRTGLGGNYDIELSWTPDQLPPRGPGAGPNDPIRINGVDIDPNGPSLFTAIQEQLGLKLAPTRAPVNVLVVDGVQRLTPD
jgi:uncharacterized protein (TIGR03435 family)